MPASLENIRSNQVFSLLPLFGISIPLISRHSSRCVRVMASCLTSGSYPCTYMVPEALAKPEHEAIQCKMSLDCCQGKRESASSSGVVGRMTTLSSFFSLVAVSRCGGSGVELNSVSNSWPLRGRLLGRNPWTGAR
jgi:hypothetical protein